MTSIGEGLKRTYQLLGGDDEPPADSVILGISTDIDPPLATIIWTGEAPSEDGPMDVDLALLYADLKAARRGLNRVMVSIDDPARWRPEWGELQPA